MCARSVLLHTHSYIFNLIPNKNYNKLLSVACRWRTHTHTRTLARMESAQSECDGNGWTWNETRKSRRGWKRKEPKFNNVYQFGSFSAWMRGEQASPCQRDIRINALIEGNGAGKKRRIFLSGFGCVACCVRVCCLSWLYPIRPPHFIACVVARCHRHFM